MLFTVNYMPIVRMIDVVRRGLKCPDGLFHLAMAFLNVSNSLLSLFEASKPFFLSCFLQWHCAVFIKKLQDQVFMFASSNVFPRVPQIQYQWPNLS